MIHCYMSWYMILTLICGTWHVILDTWYLTLTLDMLYLTPDLWHVIYDTDARYVILDTWSTTLDIWHWYLICHTWHLIHGTWYLTPVLDLLSLDTWYLTPDIGHLIHDTWYHSLDMLSHGTSIFDLILWYWLDTITPDTRIILHIHDYHFYGDLAWLLYCYQIFGTPELLCSWTPVYLNPKIGRLLTLCSWYYTPVDPRNRITMDIGLLRIPYEHYH